MSRLLLGVAVCAAWIDNLTAPTPYKPLLVALTVGLLGYGFYLVYVRNSFLTRWRAARLSTVCSACAPPLSSRRTSAGLWLATILVAAAYAFGYLEPFLLSG